MAFDLQPTLRGELVILRPLHADDFDALYAAACDPLIWEQHPQSDRHKPEIFQAFFDDAIASGGALSAIEAASGDVIGSSRFYGFDPDESEVEIGWTFLARKFWGGIHNGEMKRLMIDHAFQFVDHVVLLIGPENIRSQRAAEKVGGIFAGEMRERRGTVSRVYRISATKPR